MSEDELRQDAELRDRARSLFRGSLARLREDASAGSLAGRARRRAIDGGRGFVEDIGEFAQENAGKLGLAAAAAGTALAAWLAREPLAEWLSGHTRDYAEDSEAGEHQGNQGADDPEAGHEQQT